MQGMLAPEEVEETVGNVEVRAIFRASRVGTIAATRVVQGAIERSNVSGITEMAEMIRVQRAYDPAASLAQKQDDMRRSAIQRLGDANA